MSEFYKYYKIGSKRPFRALFNDEVPDVPSRTEAPDPDTGELVLTMALITRLDGDDTWEIDKAEFNELLAEYQAKIRKQR